MSQGKLGEVILRGTRALQPLATTVADGTLYCVTDEASIVERSNHVVWQSYSPTAAGAAINQLTGDVTAGPGSGSQVATIGNDKVVTAKILNAAVTYAKIQAVSAISKLLGRGAAAGAGAVEEITLGAGLTMTGTTLSASGGGGGGWNLLATRTAAASASLDFTSLITSTYDDYVFTIDSILPANTNTAFIMRVSTNNGSSYDSASNYAYTIAYADLAGVTGGSASTSATQIILTGPDSNVASRGGSNGSFMFRNPLNAAGRKSLTGQFSLAHDNTGYYLYNTAAWYIPTTAVNAVQFLYDSGNIASGVVRMYGISK